MKAPADDIRKRGQLFFQLRATEPWAELVAMLREQHQRALEECLTATSPREWFQGYVTALREIEGAVESAADRHRTENDPVEQAKDQTRLMADLLRTGRGGLA